MPKITFIAASGSAKQVEGAQGQSVMQVALDHLIPGILGDCGGNCSCATCHAYIDLAWVDRVPAAEDAEKSMLECALDTRPNSRLTCQIVVTDQLDGLVVHVPVRQL